LLSRNPNQPVFWHFPVLSKYQGRDTIGGVHLFHAKIRKYFAGGRILSSLPIVRPKVFAQFPDVSPHDIREKRVLNTLSLNSATEHEISHSRLAAVHDAEPDNAVGAKPVFTT
jgi:hypothetical protein